MNQKWQCSKCGKQVTGNAPNGQGVPGQMQWGKCPENKSTGYHIFQKM
jgi:hypothetical protein